MMKVLLINGSPRERGNTRAALDEMLKRYPKDASFKKMDREFAVNNL